MSTRHFMKKVNLILLIIWMIIIFILSGCDSSTSSSQSGFVTKIIVFIFRIEDYSNLESIIRTIAHFTEYFILSILMIRYLVSINYLKYYSIGFTLIYSLSDEIHQIFVPGRAFEIKDLVIDNLGNLTGFVFYILFVKLIFLLKSNSSKLIE